MVIDSSEPVGRIVTAVVVLLSAACGSSASQERASVTRRDSASVEIVESHAARWGPGEGYRLSATPTIDLGGDERNGMATFAMAIPIHRRSDGAILVHERGTEIRVFDSAGSFLRRGGGAGGGPGEFRTGLASIIHPIRGDSLLAVEAMTGRIVMFDPDAKYVREWRPKLEGFQLDQTFYAFADGSLLATEFALPLATEERCRPGVHRYSPRHWRLGSDNKVLADYGPLFDYEELSFGGPNVETCDFSAEFRPRGTVATDGTGLYYSAGDRFEIKLFGEDGRLTRIIRRDADPVPLERAEIDASIDRSLGVKVDPEPGARPRPGRESRRKTLAALDYPKTKPAITMLLVDAARNLWVAESKHADGSQPWSVFDSSGVFLGNVLTPSRISVREIGRDYVLTRCNLVPPVAGLDERVRN